MATTLDLHERRVQEELIELMRQELGYRYMGRLDGDIHEPNHRDVTLKKETAVKAAKIINRNVRPAELSDFLRKQGWSIRQCDQAYYTLQNAAACHSWKDLYDANEKVWNLITSTTSVRPEPGEIKRTVSFIDWHNPDNNDFAVAEEVTVLREGSKDETRRPDLVVYVNGIALVVIELKRAAVSVAEGIRQNYRNQQDGEIPGFFSTVQLVMAGNPSEGVRYGTIKTPEKYFVKWKEPVGDAENEKEYASPFTAERFPNELYRSILQMLDKKRLLDIIKNCIIFDGGVKKVARPNQFFALQAAKPRILAKDSGIIWHSQGSGKSLTMVWLAKWIHENVADARVVVITDRDELDYQITERFELTGEDDVRRAKSGKQLIGLLNDGEEPWLITTLVHKFGAGGRGGRDAKPGQVTAEQFIKELRENLPHDFKAKGNIFVFVDECHRTQGGKLNRAMKEILGDDVMFIGFTGTPLLKKDKNVLTSNDNFGRYIHSYRFDEAVDDGVVLDLRYEARFIDQQLSDANALNQIFEHQTKALTEKARMALQDRWAQLQKVYSSNERMLRIVGDILKDMMLLPALYEGYGNAMLVAEDIYTALKYWHLFDEQDFGQHCAVVCSYNDVINLDEGYTGEQKTEEELKNMYFHKMIGDKPYEQFEHEVKERFVKRPADMKLLIVVDKLLTGFDAPSATYLYLDRTLRDHNLFQAICRVNRVNGEQKEFGYIVDYKELFPRIQGAIEDYTNGEGAFSGYDKDDVEGLLKDRLKEARRELEGALLSVEKLCEKVEGGDDKQLTDYLDYFCVHHTTPADSREVEIIKNSTHRDDFYQAVMRLSRRYSMIAMQMDEAGFTAEETRMYADKVKMYDELRHAVMKCSGDYVDMKMYDAQMRALLDRYIVAPRSEKLESLDDFSFLDIIHISDGKLEVDEDAERELGGERGVAETMASNVRRVINRKRESNPEEYKKFSDRLNRLLEDMRQKRIEYSEFLRGIKDLTAEMRSQDDDPWKGTSPQKKAFYDNFGHDEDFAEYLYEAVHNVCKTDFKTSPVKKRIVERTVRKALVDTDYNVDDVMRIISAQNW